MPSKVLSTTKTKNSESLAVVSMRHYQDHTLVSRTMISVNSPAYSEHLISLSPEHPPDTLIIRQMISLILLIRHRARRTDAEITSHERALAFKDETKINTRKTKNDNMHLPTKSVL